MAPVKLVIVFNFTIFLPFSYVFDFIFKLDQKDINLFSIHPSQNPPFKFLFKHELLQSQNSLPACIKCYNEIWEVENTSTNGKGIQKPEMFLQKMPNFSIGKKLIYVWSINNDCHINLILSQLLEAILLLKKKLI